MSRFGSEVHALKRLSGLTFLELLKLDQNYTL